MKKKPGDVWTEERSGPNGNHYWIILEMTGSGGFNWPMIYASKESADAEIKRELGRVENGKTR